MAKKYHGPKVDAVIQPSGTPGHYTVTFKPHRPEEVPRNGNHDYIGDWLKQLLPWGEYDAGQRVILVGPKYLNKIPDEVCHPFVRTVDVGKYHDARGRYKINNEGRKLGITVVG